MTTLKHLISFSPAALVLFLLWGATAYALPKWATRPPEDKKYLYFVGVATSPSLEEGRRSAIAGATAQLLEHIEFQGRSYGHRQRTELANRINDELFTRSASNQISGLTLREWHYEKHSGGMYDVYVLLRYPREELTKEKERLERERAERVSRITGIMASGRAEEHRGKVAAAVNLYLQAIYLAVEDENEALEGEAFKRLSSLVRGIRMERVSGQGQKSALFGTLPEPLIIRVMLETDRGEMPAAGIPVRFEFVQGNGQLQADDLTDDQGEARSHAARVFSLSGSGLVQAAIDVERFLPFADPVSRSTEARMQNLWEDLKSLHVEFPFQITMARKNLRVIVLVEEENLGSPRQESILGSEISALLLNAGYTVIADHEVGKSSLESLRLAFDKNQFFSLRKEFRALADIVVAGTCRTRDPSRNFGWIDSAFVDVHIRAVSLQAGEFIAQVNLVGGVGFGQTVQQAGINAIRKATITAAQSLTEQLLARGTWR